jgi:hypothetical protein
MGISFRVSFMELDFLRLSSMFVHGGFDSDHALDSAAVARNALLVPSMGTM